MGESTTPILLVLTLLVHAKIEAFLLLHFPTERQHERLICSWCNAMKSLGLLNDWQSCRGVLQIMSVGAPFSLDRNNRFLLCAICTHFRVQLVVSQVACTINYCSIMACIAACTAIYREFMACTTACTASSTLSSLHSYLVFVYAACTANVLHVIWFVQPIPGTSFDVQCLRIQHVKPVNVRRYSKYHPNIYPTDRYGK